MSSETLSDLDRALAPALEAAAPVFDPLVLGQLRELDPTGQAGVVARILAAYEASLHQVLGQLREQQGLAVPDAALLGGRAHMLKSSSASVGALGLAHLCEAIEANARDTGSVKAQELDAFCGEIQATLKAIGPLLGQA